MQREHLEAWKSWPPSNMDLHWSDVRHIFLELRYKQMPSWTRREEGPAIAKLTNMVKKTSSWSSAN
jgi:hypothetical protein